MAIDREQPSEFERMSTRELLKKWHWAQSELSAIFNQDTGQGISGAKFDARQKKLRGDDARMAKQEIQKILIAKGCKLDVYGNIESGPDDIMAENEKLFEEAKK